MKFYYQIVNKLKFFFFKSTAIYTVIFFIFSYSVFLLSRGNINFLQFLIFLIILFYFFILLIEKKINFENIPFRKGSPIEFISNFMANKNLDAAEIGVYEGNHAEYILKNKFFKNRNVKLKNLYLIDPFEKYIDANKNTYMDKGQGDLYFKNLKVKFKDYKNVKIIRKKSVDASKDFKDESLDFIYIDGNHQYESFKNDLRFWYPKVKKFGIISGDDYGIDTSEGIIKALQEFCFEKKIYFHYAHYGSQFFFIKI